jgi:hypothetical protein
MRGSAAYHRRVPAFRGSIPRREELKLLVFRRSIDLVEQFVK